VTDDVSPRLHSQYGTCGACHQLKHVRPEGTLRDHNRFAVRGTAIAPVRCAGSGALALELLNTASPEVRRTA
jgi:hypothetical protein